MQRNQYQFPTAKEAQILMQPVIDQQPHKDLVEFANIYEMVFMPCTDKKATDQTRDKYVKGICTLADEMYKSNPDNCGDLIAQQLNLYPSGLDGLIF